MTTSTESLGLVAELLPDLVANFPLPMRISDRHGYVLWASTNIDLIQDDSIWRCLSASLRDGEFTVEWFIFDAA
jgi:hypothetical protein